MARQLILVRHAKSAWPDGVADHERPLAGRGRRDAPEIGRWLAGSGIEPEVAYVSSAARARATFELLSAELTSPVRSIVTDDVYGASTGDLLDLVRSADDDVRSVLIVGHNPGIGTLASVLDDRQSGLLDFKTSAVAVFDVGTPWADVNPGAARLAASAVPRAN
ncbi:MAG TPA: histidine phosphatase family protein [Jiangellaceae bacterium]